MRKKSGIPETHPSPAVKEWEEYLKSMTPEEKLWNTIGKYLTWFLIVGSNIFLFTHFIYGIITGKDFLKTFF